MSKNINYFILLGFFIGIVSAFAPMEALSPLAVLVCGLLLIVLLVMLFSRQEDIKFLLFFCLTGFSIRILSSVFFLNLFNLINRPWDVLYLGKIYPSFIELDGTTYGINGFLISRIWHMGIMPDKNTLLNSIYFGTILGSYDYWNAMVFYFTGYSEITVVFINCLAGSLSILFIYLISGFLFTKRVTRLSVILVALWPSLVFYSTQSTKEPIATLLVCMAIWGVLGLYHRFYIFYIIPVIAGLKALLYLRYETAILLIGAIALSLGIIILKRLKVIAIILILLLTVTIIKLNPFQLSYGQLGIMKTVPQLEGFLLFKPPVADESLLGLVNYMRSVRSEGKLAFMPDFDISTPLGFLIYLPLGIMAFLFAPFPWQAGSMSQIFAAPEMIVWYFLVPFLFYGVFHFYRDKEMISKGSVILIFIFASGLLMAVLDGNIGTLFRHKSMLMPLLLLFVSFGFIRKKEQKICHL